MTGQRELPACSHDVATIHQLLLAAYANQLVMLPSADSAGPDAAELLWVMAKELRIAHKGQDLEADAVQHLLTHGLLTLGENGRFWLTGCGVQQVKAVHLELTDEGERQLIRLNLAAQQPNEQGTGGGSR
ncbi:hypothetical protein ACVDFE_00275 [Lentzea chajnantorensis]